MVDVRGHYDQAVSTSVLQSHEIVHLARAIADKAKSLRKRDTNRDLLNSRLYDIEGFAQAIIQFTEIRRFLKMPTSDLNVERHSFASDLLLGWRSFVSHQAEVQLKALQYIPPAEPILLWTDQSAVTMVVQNLLRNALDYSAKCTPILMILESQGRDAVFEVTDYGIGLPCRDGDRIWEEGWRGDEARKVREQGTGIGLFIVKHILTELKVGKILEVKSEQLAARNIFLLHFLNKCFVSRLDLPDVPDLSKEEQIVVDAVFARRTQVYEKIRQTLDRALKGRFAGLSPKVWSRYVEGETVHRTTFRVKFWNLQPSR